ncbi:MAG: hypothetical protein Q8P60_13450 [Pseudorhodobacter sp.]|nr:hypothetical protein [Pseudorhodobacter sp.]
MGAATIGQMADRVSALMEERLRIRGRGLAEKLVKGKRALPRHVHAAGETLAQAALMSQNPRLLLQIDEQQVAEAYDICLRHLGRLGRGDRRKGMLLNMAASIAFSLLVLAGLVIGVLVWRGFL